jgi:hypothetical protein
MGTGTLESRVPYLDRNDVIQEFLFLFPFLLSVLL